MKSINGQYGDAVVKRVVFDLFNQEEPGILQKKRQLKRVWKFSQIFLSYYWINIICII